MIVSGKTGFTGQHVCAGEMVAMSSKWPVYVEYLTLGIFGFDTIDIDHNRSLHR